MFHHATLRIALIALVLSFVAIAELHAQDTLYLNNGQNLVVQVQEVGLDEIKYNLPGKQVTMSVDKDDVHRVAMHDGTPVPMDGNKLKVAYSPEVMAKRNVIKAEFLSPAFNHITMGYERVLKPWMNLEVRAGYIGAGNPSFRMNTSGAMLAAGIKFIKRPDHMTRGMRLTHPLAGGYVKPEILFNTFSESYRTYDLFSTSTSRERYTNMAFQVVFGKQSLLGGCVTIDRWVGIGYGMQSNNLSYEQDNSWCYTHVFLSHKLPIVLSAGLTLGVAF